jgi:predicted TPR repeat methyltransferase
MNEALMRQAANLQQVGRFAEAAQCYQQILRANPRHFEALFSLGMICVHTEQFEEGQRILGDALKLNPRFGEGWCARGIVLLQLRRREEALTCFDQSLALVPDFLEALSSRATALLEMGRHDEALVAFDRVLALRPDHAISWNNRGNTFVAMRRLEEAVASFDRALALAPDLETARNNRNLALLELKQIDRIPAVAVRTLFDDYSSYYDAAMVDSLGYRAPSHLRDLATRVMPGTVPPMRILDLGCGTGLSGEAFKDLAVGGRLDGIDLSPGMIEEARRRNIYSDLIVEDFETALAAPGLSYDLIIAGDALIYHGDLLAVFSGAARRLDPGGFCLFTVEKMDGEGWEQTPANRFRHSEAYLRVCAEQSGFAVTEIVECALRRESNAPVEGFAVALRKAPSGEAR